MGVMKLLEKIRACQYCVFDLPWLPKPILQFSAQSKILIMSQAPGKKAHETGIPWNDASGIRLRSWLRLNEKTFYNPEIIAIVPMGFCYPGKGKSGDLPPRPECSELWMKSILEATHQVEYKILIGTYAAEYFLGKGSLSEKIKLHAFNDDSNYIVLPHPSPLNNIWLSKNRWFEAECLPRIQLKMKSIIDLM